VSVPGRRRADAPGRGRLAVRRGAAIVVLLALLALFGWLGVTVAGRGGEKPAPATTAVAPPPKPLRIVFPEGFTRRDMAQRITAVDGIARRKRHVNPRLSARAYLRLTATGALVPRGFGSKPKDLEGFLFPATYDFTRRTTTRQLILAQLKAFRREWSTVDLAYARRKNLTPYDVLVIASMVEKEALAPAERPKIAAVIYNRLRERMPLGIDATIRYALRVPGTESLRESQLSSDTPYNTRKFLGLPPGPISNPGLASIRAAAHPARVDYLYFVRKPDKVHHFFTASYREFVNYANAHGF
jgi:peptidoglycan lytic transglycosylase G